MTSTHQRGLAGLAAAGLVILTAASCSSDNHTTHQHASAMAAAATGHARLGPLTITGGYIPQPASPDVAAAYLTITDSGATPDTITTITTSVTNTVTAMNETSHNGVGTMTTLHSVTIPAHGTVSLTPGHAHLMLQNPTSRLHAGQHITATIVFIHAGTVTLTLPVTPLTAPGPTMTMGSPAS